MFALDMVMEPHWLLKSWISQVASSSLKKSWWWYIRVGTIWCTRLGSTTKKKVYLNEQHNGCQLLMPIHLHQN